MNFLEGVNIVLREGGIIAGDDDEVSAFTDTQHENHVNLAKRAIKRELNDLLSDKNMPFEEAEGYLTMVSGQRAYALESDFIRFSDAPAFMLEVESASATAASKNRKIYHYIGDEQKIRKELMDYRDILGEPQYFYAINAETHQVGMYPVPNASENGEVYRYWYQKSLTVTTETDNIPVINEQAAESFIEGCTVHFNYLRMTPQERQVLYPQGVQFDPDLQQARAKTLEFVRKTAPIPKYGRKYG